MPPPGPAPPAGVMVDAGRLRADVVVEDAPLDVAVGLQLKVPRLLSLQTKPLRGKVEILV